MVSPKEEMTKPRVKCRLEWRGNDQAQSKAQSEVQVGVWEKPSSQEEMKVPMKWARLKWEKINLKVRMRIIFMQSRPREWNEDQSAMWEWE